LAEEAVGSCMGLRELLGYEAVRLFAARAAAEAGAPPQARVAQAEKDDLYLTYLLVIARPH
jgi:hypothetical protein